MASEVWHELGPVAGACTVCGTDGRLSMGEVCVRPSLAERLRRDPVARPARLVTCSSCGWRWTVRATDTPPVAAAVVVHRREDQSDEPAPVGDRRHEPAAVPVPRAAEVPDAARPGRHARPAARTVLPSPRGRRALTARLHG